MIIPGVNDEALFLGGLLENTRLWKKCFFKLIRDLLNVEKRLPVHTARKDNNGKTSSVRLTRVRCVCLLKLINYTLTSWCGKWCFIYTHRYSVTRKIHTSQRRSGYVFFFCCEVVVGAEKCQSSGDAEEHICQQFAYFCSPFFKRLKHMCLFY